MKTFFWKDKTGRGITNIFISDEIIIEQNENEYNWDGEPLNEWATWAEEGDTWENATDYYICTQS